MYLHKSWHWAKTGQGPSDWSGVAAARTGQEARRVVRMAASEATVMLMVNCMLMPISDEFQNGVMLFDCCSLVWSL